MPRPGKTPWDLLLEIGAQEEYVEKFIGCGYDLATVVFLSKCMLRLAKFVINNWRSKPEFPKDKGFLTKMNDVEAHWRREVGKFTNMNKLRTPAKHIKRLEGLTSSTLINDYYSDLKKRERN